MTMTCLNAVTLLGCVSKYGVTLRFHTTGTPVASFALYTTEQGADGSYHSTLVPCECWGRKAESASEIAANTLCLFQGKLAKRKKGEQWELIVSGFELTPVGVSLAATARTN